MVFTNGFNAPLVCKHAHTPWYVYKSFIIEKYDVHFCLLTFSVPSGTFDSSVRSTGVVSKATPGDQRVASLIPSHPEVTHRSDPDIHNTEGPNLCTRHTDYYVIRLKVDSQREYSTYIELFRYRIQQSKYRPQTPHMLTH